MFARTKVIHYENQFFAGIGGEEQANVPPLWIDGPKGPGQLISQIKPQFDVVATVAAGDNYMAEDLSHRSQEVVSLIEQRIASDHELKPDLIVAGPAFNAGRYGMACAAVCQAAQQRLKIPAVTALYPENPAVENYRSQIVIVRSEASVLGMRAAMQDMLNVGRKLMEGELILPDADHTIARGIRHNYFATSNGASRALNMLMRKIAGEAYASEYTMPTFDRVPPAPPIADLTQASIAVVTSGGIVPRGNPDHIESASASRFGAYSLAGLDQISSESHCSVHGGYDTTYANEDPNRVLPIGSLRELESEGKFGHLYETYFATVGNATAVRRAVQFGREIAALLVNAGVQAVILTST